MLSFYFVCMCDLSNSSTDEDTVEELLYWLLRGWIFGDLTHLPYGEDGLNP